MIIKIVNIRLLSLGNYAMTVRATCNHKALVLPLTLLYISREPYLARKIFAEILL